MNQSRECARRSKRRASTENPAEAGSQQPPSGGLICLAGWLPASGVQPPISINSGGGLVILSVLSNQRTRYILSLRHFRVHLQNVSSCPPSDGQKRTRRCRIPTIPVFY